MAEKVAELAISTPIIPVVHNVHAQTERDPEKIKELLVKQIHSPVQWTHCIQTMVAANIGATLECGPGKVLSGLSKRIDKSLTSFNIEKEEDYTLKTLIVILVFFYCSFIILLFIKQPSQIHD